jgi:hypothetical protein
VKTVGEHSRLCVWKRAAMEAGYVSGRARVGTCVKEAERVVLVCLPTNLFGGRGGTETEWFVCGVRTPLQ